MGVTQTFSFADKGATGRAFETRVRASRHGVTLWIVVAVVTSLLAAPAAAQNLLQNGNFEGPVNEHGEPRGWHTRITGLTPIPEYTDPANKKGRTGVTHFKCGCGYMWGTVRPWAGLFCPQCKQMNLGLEDSSEYYQKNHESVTLGQGRTGRGVRIKMDGVVGGNQGVRVVSAFARAEDGAAYEISFDATSASDAHLRVFVEGFRMEPDDKAATEWVKTLPAESNPFKQTIRLKRVFRKAINVQHPAQWTTYREQFHAPQRYRFDVMYVNLYAYMPGGEAGYDNVVLRKLNPAETKRYFEENPPPREGRFR